MTNKEAIEELRTRYLTMSQCLDKEELNRANIALDMAIEVLDQEPKTGHWIVAKGDSYLGMRNACCSNCKDFYTNDWDYMNYCPNCGARMIESEKDKVGAKTIELLLAAYDFTAESEGDN